MNQSSVWVVVWVVTQRQRRTKRGEFSLTNCPVAESPNHKRKKVVAFVFDFFFVVVGGSSNVF